MNTELEEMREQLATLKKKLEKQEIVLCEGSTGSGALATFLQYPLSTI